MKHRSVRKMTSLAGLVWLTTACAAAPTPGPERFESEDFLVSVAREGETTRDLASRLLGDPAKAWMVEDYNAVRTLAAGQAVVVPKRPWNLAGVEPSGYQLVPILVYHNIMPQARGRLVIAAERFEEQMRYLKREGYRVVSLGDFIEFTSLKRQLPRKAVVLTFDDAWKSFREYAYPLLKELGFTATLFIYTDFIGARSALSWDDLRQFALEGFEIHAHSKTHEDLRRRTNETDQEYDQRMVAELARPVALFRQHLGRGSQVFAYPYGSHDDELVRRVAAHEYIAAFDVRRQGNPSFGVPLTLHRSQIYATMSLEEFARNLDVFHREPIR